MVKVINTINKNTMIYILNTNLKRKKNMKIIFFYKLVGNFIGDNNSRIFFGIYIKFTMVLS